jgi:hypothetical protein
VYGSQVSAIEVDVVAEGKRLLARAGEAGVRLRLLGGVAIYLRAPGELAPPFARSYADLDFVTARADAGPTAQLLRAEGYEPHVAFNALHGNERMLFFDEVNGRQVDVFVGAFRMCHRIPLNERVEVDPLSIPLAELLLTKLQVIELNEKDVRDTLALLQGHPVGDEDGETVNASRIARLCAEDWGLWRTITRNLAGCYVHVEGYDLPENERRRIGERLEAIVARIDAEPKSRAWRLRARIGDRKRWYELPEEVAGGP